MNPHTARRRRARATYLWASGLLALSAPVAAQDQEPARPVEGVVEVHLGVTRLAGVWSGFSGASATLDVGAGLRLGGGAWSVLRRVDEGPVLAGSGLELSVGYGGVVVEWTVPSTPVAGRLLVGGGMASLRTLAVGTRFDVETFAVLEPGLRAGFDLPGPLSMGAVFGYRWVGGADALFLADSSDLRGIQGSIHLRIGGS